MLSVCTIRFEDRFCASRRGGIGEAPCRGYISGIVGSFQSGGMSSGWRTLTVECLLMSGCGQGRELAKKDGINYSLKRPLKNNIQRVKTVKLS